MFCRNCGSQIQDGVKFCPNCGSVCDVAPVQPEPQTPLAPQYPMKWFKFLIYFALFASGILNLISGIQMVTGSQYGDLASDVYDYFPGLQSVDIICGLLSIALGVLLIYTRFRLAQYRANGPMLLLICYASSGLLNLVYMIAVYAILEGELDVSSSLMSVGISLIMVSANNVYFKNRRPLFIH